MVKGATVIASPKANTITAGSTPSTYERDPVLRIRRANPAPTTTGPTLICRRGPIFAASCPDRPDNSSMTTVSGISAAPA